MAELACPFCGKSFSLLVLPRGTPGSIEFARHITLEHGMRYVPGMDLFAGRLVKQARQQERMSRMAGWKAAMPRQLRLW